MPTKTIAMITTLAQGGMAALIDNYKACGLLDRWRVVVFAPHLDIRHSFGRKFFIALCVWLRYMLRLLAGEIGLVHAHVSLRASVWRKSAFMLPALWLRVPVIFHLHGGEFKEFFEDECNALGRRIIRYQLTRASVVIALSEHWGRFFSDLGVRHNVSIIPNFVMDVPNVDLRGRDQNLRLQFLGEVAKGKGIYDLLRACAEVVPVFPDLRLFCAGQGDMDELQQEIRRLDLLQHVLVLGWVAGAEKDHLLRSANVFVLPSYSEGFPMSTLEAMSYGLPVVATTVGGIPDQVESGKEGILYRAGDIRALVEALIVLGQDPESRRKMGSAARARVERDFTAAVVLPRLERIYENYAPHCRGQSSVRVGNAT